MPRGSAEASFKRPGAGFAHANGLLAPRGYSGQHDLRRAKFF